ncbi:temperature-induced lipocalin-1-like [Oryza glaberrima]|nr:temperature-induced lipocalin-1-like [Oryza glaberrima]
MRVTFDEFYGMPSSVETTQPNPYLSSTNSPRPLIYHPYPSLSRFSFFLPPPHAPSLHAPSTGSGGGLRLHARVATTTGHIEGTTYRTDPASDEAKLKVKFYVPPFLPIFPVVGDYWVLHVDDAYSYALVGQPSLNYLWILCRQPHMDEEVYNQLVERAKEEGHDVSKLKKTAHPDPLSESEQSAGDRGVWWIKSLFGR